MRILFLTYQGDVAGSTYSISYLATGLASRGHAIYMGIRKESLLWKLMEGTSVTNIPMSFKGKFDFTNWKQIRDAVKKYDIQLINAQSSHDRYTSIFAKFRYGLKVKIIHTRRQMPMSMGDPIQLYLYNKKTDGIVAVSEQMKFGLCRLGIHSKHIKVIPNGTPTEKYHNVSEEKVNALKLKFDICEQDFVIGCVSRMKNQLQIVQALEHLTFPVKMIFCGISPTQEMKQIMDRCTQEHQFFFEGHVEPNDVLPYYKIFDIKILASTMEGLSQSLLEAMALGTPVIATAYAGNLDLIDHEVNGLLFADGDINELKEHITKLYEDEPFNERLKKAGKKRALLDFNIENTISKYEEYFRQLVAEN